MSTSFSHPGRAAVDSPVYYRPPRRRSRWLLILLPVLAIFIGFASIVWLAYVEGAPASAVGEPPLIKADLRPIKLAPDDPGGRAIPDQGELGDMLANEVPEGPERLLPPPEEPLVPPAVEELAAASEQAGPSVETTPVPAPGAAPAVPETPPAGPAAAVDSLFRPDESQQAAAPASEPPATAAGDTPVAPAPTVETRPAAAPRTAASEDVAAAPARPEPTIRPGSPEQLQGAPSAGQSPPVVARADPTSAIARPSGAASLDGPHYRIQLAAVRDEADARRAWDLFQQDLGGLLSGVEPIFERGETSNGVFYRVQLGPYADLTRAETLCEELKRRNASCFVLRR